MRKRIQRFCIWCFGVLFLTQCASHPHQSVNHLVKSQLKGVVSHPVSSTYQLAAYSTSTAVEFILPKPELYFEKGPYPPVNLGPAMDLNAWEKTLDKVKWGVKSSGKVTMLSGGDAFFSRLEQSILDAEDCICLRTFIFDNDDYALRIADLLKQKSKTIPVQVLVDGIGQIMGASEHAETIPEDYVDPGPIVKYLRDGSRIDVRVRPNVLLKSDHSKTIVIDQKTAFIGGMNIGREYRYEWHDLMFELEGPVVGHLMREFRIAWKYASDVGDLRFLPAALARRCRQKCKSPKVDSSYPPIRLLFTRPGAPEIHRAQCLAMRKAKNYIYINNSYLASNSIIAELIKARRRGVDVRVIMPKKGNHEIMNKSNVITANVLFKNGVRVYFYPGMSHAKAAIYDGWLCTGSANFDKLSLKDNLELNIATSHPETVAKIKSEVFDQEFLRIEEMKGSLESGVSERVAEMVAEVL